MDMANKDGFSVLNEMKLLPELGAARFVAFTSVVDDEIKQRGTVDEFSQHIQKPASIAALLNLIH
jgi:response regulator RpfG family c-di-GMP phosphodiesterase